MFDEANRLYLWSPSYCVVRDAKILWSEFWPHSFVEKVSVIQQHEKEGRPACLWISVEGWASISMLPVGRVRGGCRWEVGHVPWHNVCGRPFGILLLKQCCASPSEVSLLPLREGYSLLCKDYSGAKKCCTYLPVVLLSWRLVRSDVWIVAIIKNNFLRPGI